MRVVSVVCVVSVGVCRECGGVWCEVERMEVVCGRVGWATVRGGRGGGIRRGEEA